MSEQRVKDVRKISFLNLVAQKQSMPKLNCFKWHNAAILGQCNCNNNSARFSQDRYVLCFPYIL